MNRISVICRIKFFFKWIHTERERGNIGNCETDGCVHALDCSGFQGFYTYTKVFKNEHFKYVHLIMLAVPQ